MFLCFFLRKKDSKSRTKINASPGLIRAYVRTLRTDVRTRATTKFSWLDGFTNFYGYGAPLLLQLDQEDASHEQKQLRKLGLLLTYIKTRTKIAILICHQAQEPIELSCEIARNIA